MDLEKALPSLTALIGPVVAAFAAALVVWLRETIMRRDEVFRRRKVVAAATKEVQFIQAWIEASRELHRDGTPSWVNDQVGADLDHAYALVAQARTGDAARGRKRLGPREVTGAVLLLGKLTSPWARVGLVVYYALLLGVIGFSMIALSPSESVTGSYVFVVLVYLLFLLWIVRLWRSLLLWIDRRYRAARNAISVDGSPVSAAPANEAFLVLVGGVWREGVLSEWRPNGASWAGRIRFTDGTLTDWVRAEYLRYARDPNANAKFETETT